MPQPQHQQQHPQQQQQQLQPNTQALPLTLPQPQQQQQPSPEQNIDMTIDPIIQQSQQPTAQPNNNVGQQCFPEPTQNDQLSYYTPRHPGQGSMLAPPGFPPLHYLSKPLLPGMNGMDQATLEQYAIPDLLPGNNGHNMHHPANTTANTTPSPGSNTKPKASDLRLFKCLTCGKDFKQKSTLLQHERIHTDSRPYGCSECGKRFRQQSHLTQHLRIHANEKPYACAYCPRSFRQRAILNQHLRIHSGEKPYACPECGKHFRQKAILNQHVRTHQGERQFYLVIKPTLSITRINFSYLIYGFPIFTQQTFHLTSSSRTATIPHSGLRTCHIHPKTVKNRKTNRNTDTPTMPPKEHQNRGHVSRPTVPYNIRPTSRTTKDRRLVTRFSVRTSVRYNI